jgi:hypothetical protein
LITCLKKAITFFGLGGSTYSFEVYPKRPLFFFGEGASITVTLQVITNFGLS